MIYANGRAPASSLTIVDGVPLVPSIAPRVEAFIAWATTQGYVVRIAHPLGGYRTYSQQGELSGTGNSASSIPVAKPGYSTHGDYTIGRVDLVGPDGYTYTAPWLAWVVAHAPAFGLVREFGAADPNHFMQAGAFAGMPAVPIRAVVNVINPREDSEMKFLYVTDSVDGNNVPGWALLNVNTGKLLTTRDQAVANGWATVWGNAQSTARQNMLDAVDAIQKTS